MIHFEILGKRYKLKNEWKDIVLREVIELAKIQPPDILVKIAMGEATEADVTYEHEVIEFPKFYKSFLGILSDADINEMSNMEAEMLFKSYLIKISAGVLNPPINGEVPECKSIWIDGAEYVFPDSENILGMDFPIAKESTEMMVDTSSLYVASRGLSNGKFQYLSNIMSILMRPKVLNDKNEWEIEPYDDKKCLERANLFLDVQMDKIWGVFFYLYKSTSGLREIIEKYIMEAQEVMNHQVAILGTTSDSSQRTTGLKNWIGSTKQMFTKYFNSLMPK